MALSVFTCLYQACYCRVVAPKIRVTSKTPYEFNMADLCHGTGRYQRSDRPSARTQTEDRLVFSDFSLPTTLPTLRASAKLKHLSLPTRLGFSGWGYEEEALNGVFYWCSMESAGVSPVELLVPMLNSSRAHGMQGQRDQCGHQSTA